MANYNQCIQHEIKANLYCEHCNGRAKARKLMDQDNDSLVSEGKKVKNPKQ